MIIRKLISIQGIGKYKKNVPKQLSHWNGEFQKTTAIYADNATGKTTFTQILKSLEKSYDIHLLLRRKSFDYDGNIEIKFLDTNHKEITLKNGKWSSVFKNIEIFDTFYVEKNVYIITLCSNVNAIQDISVILGDECVDLYQQIQVLKKERTRQSNFRASLKTKLKNNYISLKDAEKQRNKSKERSKEIGNQINLLEKRLSEASEKSDYLNQINSYLEMFSPDMKITKLNRKSNNLFVYTLAVGGHAIREKNTNNAEIQSLSQTLSEGDKNTLAFAFFLAKLKMTKDLGNSLIVFDDPISSMDAQRRTTTINELCKISKQCGQMFVLSHDINFIKSLSKKLEGCLTLKICNNGETSYFEPYNIEDDTKSGIIKDIIKVKDYAENFHSSKYKPRDVIRCLRPILEGFFRIKYFGYFGETDWLGNMIQKIRDASPNSVFYRQKDNLEIIEEINDYSKEFHHANPENIELCINENELRIYCRRTLDLLHQL